MPGLSDSVSEDAFKTSKWCKVEHRSSVATQQVTTIFHGISKMILQVQLLSQNFLQRLYRHFNNGARGFLKGNHRASHGKLWWKAGLRMRWRCTPGGG